jgi:integrase
MLDLSRKGARERLKVRREPYWQRIKEGSYVGFRRGPDTWLARHRGANKVQTFKALTEAKDYDSAMKAALDWLAQIGAAPVRQVKRSTVKAALESYLADLRIHDRHGTATDAEGRFKRCVWKDPLANLPLESLTIDDMHEWRERLRKGRQNRSVDRIVRSVAAALTKARKLGHVGNRDAWQLSRLRDDVEDEGAAVFLSPEQRAALIEAADPATALYLRGLELTGARPSELAHATVADFNGESLRLSHRKGRPAKLRARYVVLSEKGVSFFKAQTKGKLPAAPILTEDGAQAWRRHTWSRSIRAAIEKNNAEAKGDARIPHKASAYSFRHARISELLQLHGIDPLTTAQQCGTSIAMIEKYYFEFVPNAMREKLAAVREG